MQIKRGYYAVWDGVEYEALALSSGQVALISKRHDDLAKGFVLQDVGRYVKIVMRSQLSSAYHSQLHACYRDVECEIVDSFDAKLVLAHKDNYQIAEQLGFKMREMNVYEKQVADVEVSEIWETRSPIWGFQIPEGEHVIRIR